jgi:predicted HicB family RNase H-like nuclease
MEYDKTIPVRIDEETRKALDAEALSRNVKLAWLVREILTEHVKDPALTAYRARFIHAPEGTKL